MNMVEFMQMVVLPMLSVSVLFAFWRLARGPSLPDRVVAFDLLSTLGIAVMAAYAVVASQSPESEQH